MKHIFYSACFFAALFVSADLAAQNAEQSKAPKSVRTTSLKRAIHNHMGVNEQPVLMLNPQNPTVSAPKSRSTGTETVIGQTYYDLQTNNAINYRLENHGDGTLSAIWTFSGEETSPWSERGMAYHVFDGTSWTKLPDYAQAGNIDRVESVRTGFGSLARVTGVGDIIVAHQTAINALQINRNTSFPEENWIENARTEMPLIWPRMRTGGPDGKTVHIIGLTEPEGTNFSGTPYNGINGCLLYNRSTDGGQSFDKLMVQLPGIDSTVFRSFGGDAYAMDAKGNTVAFVAGDLTTRVQMWKSTDNGETWTSRTVMPFPAQYEPWDDSQLTDFNGDGNVDSAMANVVYEYDTTFTTEVEYIYDLDSTATDSTYEYVTDTNNVVIDSFYVYTYEYFEVLRDSIVSEVIDMIDSTFISFDGFEMEWINTNDGTFAILIDNDDKVHVWFGAMNMSNDAIGDETVSYYPGTDGLRYWNEDFPIDSLPAFIAFAQDDNGDDLLDVAIRFSDGTTVPYGVGLCSFPSVGIDDDGAMYVSYASTKEGTDYLYLGEGPSFRHIYLTKSTDGGDNWVDAVDMVSDESLGFDQFAEYAYCSMARKVDSRVHMLYQRDYTPGSAVTIDDASVHPFDIPNDIIYLPVFKNFEDVGFEQVNNNVEEISLMPNPASDMATLRFKLDNTVDTRIEIFNVLGQNVSTLSTQKAAAGYHNVQLNTAEFNSGIYFVNVVAGEKSSTIKMVVKH
ncbi:MAG: T9SS type A sorting domain-containing protein [Bacteroidia bacterium]